MTSCPRKAVSKRNNCDTKPGFGWQQISQDERSQEPTCSSSAGLIWSHISMSSLYRAWRTSFILRLHMIWYMSSRRPIGADPSWQCIRRVVGATATAVANCSSLLLYLHDNSAS